MGNKKIISIFLVIAILAGVGSFLYFKYLGEPEGTYFETGDAKLIQIRKDLKEYKKYLRKQGKYNCCIKGDCDWCAIYMGHCPCAELIFGEDGEKSCPECAAAWNRKQGKFPGVDPDAIKVTTFGVYGFEEEGHHYDAEEHDH